MSIKENTEDPARLVATDEHADLRFVYLISAVAALGGLLFGFDTAVISGANMFLENQFALTAAQKGFVASCVLIGCALGAGFAGVMADQFGRKKTLLLSGCFFAVSAIWAALPGSTWQFVLARLIGGLGIGIASMLSPLYIAEVAPARIRGSLVSCNQFAIITGILLAYLVDWGCVRIFGDNAATSHAWRWMFGAGALPAFGFLSALVPVPESPRWLIKQGRAEEGVAILTRLGGRTHAQAELNEIRNVVAVESASVVDLLRPGLRRILAVGVMLAIFQQITGINTVMYYAPDIFRNAGFDTSAALLSSVGVGAINGVFTILAIALVDRLGRKPLLLIGAAGMGISIACVARAFQIEASPRIIMAALLAYVASFALTLGPVVWVLIAEIFPTRIRGRGMSIATVTLWLSCYAVSQTFPMLVARIGMAMTYYVYAAICIVMIILVTIAVPETKSKTLEEIERKWLGEAKTILKDSIHPNLE